MLETDISTEKSSPKLSSATNNTIGMSNSSMTSSDPDDSFNPVIVAAVVIGVLLIVGILVYVLYQCYFKPDQNKDNPRQTNQNSSIGRHKSQTIESLTKLKLKSKHSRIKIDTECVDNPFKRRSKNMQFGFPNLPPPKPAKSKPKSQFWNIIDLLKKQEETEAKMNSVELEPVRHSSDGSLISELMIVRARMTNEDEDGVIIDNDNSINKSSNTRSSLTLSRTVSSKSQGKRKRLTKNNESDRCE